MKNVFITVDFKKKTGRKIKPLHGVNNSPMSLYEPPPGFKEAGIPFCRLHDTAGAYGGAHFVDIPNIFPDFDADPADPASYDFALTDAYLTQLDAAGTKIFYRLGVTIENNFRIKAYHNHPPKDFKKWAEICAGVVRHYNCGWANGFKFNIEYWEIWNEPENPPMWSGTREEYFELYRVASLRLKEEFPEIKVGGYASCGFYAVNRPGCTDFYKGFVTWYDEFLKFVTAEDTRCPLDFYSWHLYSADPQEIILHANYVDAKLKAAGLDEVENIFNEWNYMTKNLERRFLEMQDNEGASFVSSAFCLMQSSPVDKAMYYDAYPARPYCGLYKFPGRSTTHTYSAFFMWNKLYQLGNEFESATEGKNVYVCAAGNKTDKAVIIANFDPKGVRVKLDLKNASTESFAGWIIDRKRNNVPFKVGDEIVLGPYSTVLLSTVAPVKETVAEASQNAVHAGLDDGAKKNKKN